jgi:hypothetical protein
MWASWLDGKFDGAYGGMRKYSARDMGAVATATDNTAVREMVLAKEAKRLAEVELS